MWCSECKEEHTPQEFCKGCGTCLLGEYGYQHGDVEHHFRVVTCLACFGFNTIEYDIIEHHPENGPWAVQELEKTFDEYWGTEGDGDAGDGDNILDL